MPTTSFPRNAHDISGNFVLGMARALAQRGHEVEVIAPESNEGTRATWTHPAPGVSVHWLPYARPKALERTFHRHGAPENLARDPLAWIGAATFPFALGLALTKPLRISKRWDAIISHWGLPTGLIASLVRDHQRHVSVFHSADVHLLAKNAKVGRVLARSIATGSDSLVFVSAALRDRFLALAPQAASKARVIAMGVERPITIDRARARDELGCMDLTLLVMSRLVPIKGVDRAIEAVRGLTGIRLVIAGVGPERARLETSAPSNVQFLGLLAGLEKAKWLSAADALVVPSMTLPSGRTEGAPTAVIEAMAAGLPIIAHPVGGLPELVRHEHSGLLSPSCDVRDLRNTILRFASDPNLASRLRQCAAEEGSKRTWDFVCPKFQTLLDEPLTGLH
jgi:glycosyltransferase involved in cell wall biosynthesis